MLKKIALFTTIITSMSLASCHLNSEGEVRPGGGDVLITDEGKEKNPKDARRFAVYGDMGRGSASQQRLAEHGTRWNLSQPLEATIFLGDNIYSDDPYDDASVKKLFGPMASIFTEDSPPVHAILGNHDHSDGHADNQINDPRLGMDGNQYYRLKDENGLYSFYMLDSEVIEFDREQRDWMAETLKTDDSQWLICVVHIPPYASDVAHDDHRPLAHLIEKACEKSGKNFDLFLSGHNHIYERRNVPRLGALMLIQGASGRNSSYDEWPEDDLRLAYYDLEESYLMLEINEEFTSGTAVNDLGVIVDSFTFPYPDN